MIRQITPDEMQGAAAGPHPGSEWNLTEVLDRLSSVPSEALAMPSPGFGNAALARWAECLSEALPDTRSHVAAVQLDLKRAGYYHPKACRNLSAVRYLAMMLSLVVFGTLAILAPKPAEPWCMFSLAAGMISGWWLPAWHIRRQAARRMKEIERAIPDLLDLTGACLSQELTAHCAMAFLARELQSIHPELAKELAIVCRQAEIDSFERALDDFEQRLDVTAIRSFTGLLREAAQSQ